MKIKIPKIVVPVPMSGFPEFASELDGKYLNVWVNPPLDFLNQYTAIINDLQMKEIEDAKKTIEGEEKAGDGKWLMQVLDQAARWLKFRKEKPDVTDLRLFEWYSTVWSQGAEDTRWTVDELRELENTDPSFLAWMIAQTWKARAEHIEKKKKA